MKKVWKCDYCYHTEEDILKMEEHEINCDKNPSNEHCLSCRFYDFNTSLYFCKVKLDKDFGQIYNKHKKCDNHKEITK